ncbi:MAG: acyl transferase [Chitinophagaceae bacterium]
MSNEIPKAEKLIQRIFSINSPDDFVETTLDVFQFQYEHNGLYKEFASLLGCNPKNIRRIEDIPFLPVSFFKTHKVQATLFEPQVIFTSSGTSGSTTSSHYIKDVHVYEYSFKRTFQELYGQVTDYCILALLPSYLERQGSSLVYMVKQLMKESGHPLNNFFLNNFYELSITLAELERQKQKTLFIGVTYALLEFAVKHPTNLQHTIVMETGGMKGRKKEMIRGEVHHELQKSFKIKSIHSEYGMTELLSQAYSKGDGLFSTPPWMKILIRDEDDPLQLLLVAVATGGINIIDLANIYSCSFISTEDIGRSYPDGSFEVLGRMDNSDIRGCSLLAI